MQSITEGRNDDTEYDVEWQQWQKSVQRDNQRRTLLFNVAIKRLNVRLHITSHQTQSQDETSCICKVKHLIIIGHFSILVVNSFWEFIFFLIFINLFSLSNRFKFNHEGPRGSRTFLWWVNILSLIVWIHVKTQLFVFYSNLWFFCFIHSLQCEHAVAGAAQDQSGHGERCFLGLLCQGDAHCWGLSGDDQTVRAGTGSEVRVSMW